MKLNFVSYQVPIGFRPYASPARDDSLFSAPTGGLNCFILVHFSFCFCIGAESQEVVKRGGREREREREGVRGAAAMAAGRRRGRAHAPLPQGVLEDTWPGVGTT